MARTIRFAATLALVATLACSQGVQAPTAGAVQPGAFITGNVVRLDGSASKDPQGRALSFQWVFVSVPAGSAAKLDDPTAMLPSFIGDVAGDYVLELAVFNGVVGSLPVRVTVHVTACGFSPPTVALAQATFSVAPRTLVRLAATASDPDNACLLGPPQTLTFAWAVVSRPSGSSAVLSDPAASGPTFTPDAVGQYQIRVVVTDSTGRISTPAFVNITATPCSLIAPSVALTPPAGGVATGSTVALGPTAKITDSNCVSTANVFSYAWTLQGKPAGSQALLSDPSSATPSFVPDRPGAYLVSLVVTNSEGISSAQAFETVNAVACGTGSPVLSNIVGTSSPIQATATDPEAGAVTTPNTGSRVTLSVPADRIADPNTGCGALPVVPFSFNWALVSTPAGSVAALSSRTDAQPTFSPDVAGVYQVSVRVTDALGNSSAPAFAVLKTTACGTNAPVASISPATPPAINANSLLGFSGSATDADNTVCPARFAVTLSFNWAVVPALPNQRSALTANTGPVTVFQASNPGNYTLQLTATASNGKQSAPATATINVDVCGSRAPVIVAVANSPAFPAPMQDVTLSATAVDDDTACGFPAPSKFTWSVLSLPQGSLAVLQSPTGAAHFVPDIEGTYVFQAVATDSTGLSSAPANVSVTTVSLLKSSVVATRTVAPDGAIVADNVDTGTVTATVLNANGQPIPGLTVRIDSTGAANTFSPTSAMGTTDVNGKVKVTIASTKAELKTFTSIVNPGPSQFTLPPRPTLTFIAGPATRVSVTGLPTTATASNTLLPFTVTALDQFANVATSYRGTVTFTSSDAQASFTPANHTFVASENGVFTGGGVALKTASPQTVTATDNVTASITGTSATVNVTPAAATGFTVTTSASAVTAGNPLSFTVKPRDPFNNIDTNYGGTANFTSTDAQVAFSPTSHLFVAGDNGSFTGTVTFKTAGPQTVTAKDSVALSIAGTSTAVAVSAAAPATAAFTQQPTNTQAGSAITPAVTVTVKDAFANLTNATVVISIGTNPAAGTLSGTTSAATVSGVATFANLSIDKAGTGYKLRAVLNPAVTGATADSNAFNITPAPAAALALTGLVSPFPIGQAGSFTVTVLDPFGNTATGYTGTVKFTSTDPKPATVPANFIFTGPDNGTHTFVNGVTFFTAGPQTLTATDTATATITGFQGTTVSGVLFAKQAAGAANTTTTGNAVASFSDGSFAVTGKFTGTTTWDAGPPAVSATTTNPADFFIARYNANGTLRWVKTVGATTAVSTVGTGIAGRSSDGSAVVVGSFSGTVSFPTTPATVLTATGSTDLFIAKYDSTGAVLWAKQARGSANGTVVPSGIAGYADGTTVTTGGYTGTPTFGFGETVSAGHAGPVTLSTGGFFLARYNLDGTLFSVTSAGAAGSVTAKGVAALADGTAVAVGDITASTTFGAFPLALKGTRDAFAVKYGTDGTTVAWATNAGGAGPPAATASATAVAAFADGKLVLTGNFTSTVTFGTAPSVTAVGTQDVFVARLNADGTAAWASRAGTASATGSGLGVAAFNVDGSAAVVGRYSTPTTFAFGATALTPASVSVNDIFIARYTSVGAVASARTAGGTGDDSANAVAGFSDTGALVIGSVSTPSSTFGSGEPGQTILNTGATAVDLFAAKYYPY